jgi:hypothetical protein
MTRRRIIASTAVLLALAGVAGGGIAWATAGDAESPVTGAAAEQAKRAALAEAGGGRVTEVERQDGDGAGVYEVEVERTDGTQVEMHLDASFRPVGSAADDDTGSEEDDAGTE